MKTVRSSSTFRQSVVCGLLCLFGILSFIRVQAGMDARLGDPGPDPDMLYFSSPSVVKKMALGYDNLLADIYWMRAIQYFGRKEEAEKRAIPYKNLAAFLDITTTLDPDLFDTYQAGSYFLSEPEPIGAGQPDEAIKLMDKGIEAHPRDWRLRRDKGMVYYIYLGDYTAAGNVWLETSRMPESPKWMAGLAATAFSQGGSMDVARALWQQQYNESPRADVKKNALNRLMSLQVAEDLWTLELLIGVYRLENGMFPRSLAGLSARESREIKTADPLGTPYAYDPGTGAVGLSPRSEVLYLEVPERYKEDFLTTLVK